MQLIAALTPSKCFVSRILTGILITGVILVLAGCGSGKANLPGSTVAGNSAPTMTGDTGVSVLATSTANDQLAEFHIEFTGISLISSSGKTVNLISSPVTTEFIHLNGEAEPIASVYIPQDVYTSAAITVGNAWFTCMNFVPSSGLQTSTFQDGQVSAANITATMPVPITVTGTTMGIGLNLSVSQSAAFSSCEGGANTTFAITPTVAITPVTIASPPTNSGNGLVRGLHGLISTISSNGGSLTVAGADGPKLNGPTWEFSTDAKTLFQGVSAVSQLSPGLPVDIDAALQADGSLLATRISVGDIDQLDLNVFSGPVNSVTPSPSVFSLLGREQQGYLDNSAYYLGAYPINFGIATFQASGSMRNLQTLPFSAKFDATSVVAGQNLSITSHVPTWPGSPLPVSTVTLMPQTLNGTVTAISSVGSFTTYTVTLAPYDLFPNLAQQSGQSNSLHQPDTLIVYADANTQMLNSDPVTIGSVFRFNGLVFNDHGTLRMDCAQVNDGVPE